ncbi:hypothetical protein LOD99_4616 [Oopsacas minuta]|uniref:ABC-type xenobiotic transporter n=1 Tax=Oopsacas minuta TaxID=111878 RepID=A0AAV7JT14_9METZ|nr:hypothetical protein LOD99_4616 [Oopsacas minuta]
MFNVLDVLAMVSDSEYSLKVWGHICGGQLGRSGVPDNANVSTMVFWTGADVPLCSQLILLTLMHIPLLLTSAFYAGVYYKFVKFKIISKILQFIVVLSLFFVLISIINFLYLYLYTRSNTISLILISLLIVKLLTWLSHTVCIIHLVYGIGYKKDRPLNYSIIYWLIVLISTLLYYRSLLTYQIHPEWYSLIDSTFLKGNFFLYTISIEIFLHIVYGTLIILSYLKVPILVYVRKLRQTDPLSQSLLNIQQSYGSIHNDEAKLPTRPINEEGVGWFSYLFFNWFNHTIKRGYKKKIESLDDLPSLPRNLKGACLLTKFNNHYTDKQLDGNNISKWHLLGSVVRVAGYKFYLAGILKLTADAVTFTGPLLLNGLVYLVENNNQPIYVGYFYVIGLFVSTLTGMLLNVHFQYLVDKVNISIRSALMNAVYQKVIRLHLAELSSFSTGQILDFMSTDASRLSSVWNVHLLWSMPVMIIICLYLLYLQVGLSFLAGLAFCIAVIAINQVLTVLIARAFKKYMECKDERIKMMSEILAGIRVIKLYAWERVFKNKIGKIRADELLQLAWVKCLDGFCVFFWACTATMMCVLTFITYSLLGNELTATRVSP